MDGESLQMLIVFGSVAYLAQSALMIWMVINWRRSSDKEASRLFALLQGPQDDPEHPDYSEALKRDLEQIELQEIIENEEEKSKPPVVIKAADGDKLVEYHVIRDEYGMLTDRLDDESLSGGS